LDFRGCPRVGSGAEQQAAVAPLDLATEPHLEIAGREIADEVAGPTFLIVLQDELCPVQARPPAADVPPSGQAVAVE
jgi:hypothetical protein